MQIAMQVRTIMWESFRDFWLPRLLFLTTLGLGLALGAAIGLAPLLVSEDAPRLLELLAGDILVRRTGLASALGLAVTAFVFFRPPGLLRSRKNRKPPGAIAGA